MTEPKLCLVNRCTCLVSTLERRNGLALGLIEGGRNDAPVCQINLAVRLLLVSQCVLHPVLVVALGEVFAGVSTTRLLAVGSGDSGLGTRMQFSITAIRGELGESTKLTRK